MSIKNTSRENIISTQYVLWPTLSLIYGNGMPAEDALWYAVRVRRNWIAYYL